MLNSLISVLFNLGLNLVARWGYLGLIFGTALSSMLVPIPSAATLGFSGYLVYTQTLNYSVAILSGALGNVLGSSITYFISRHVGRRILFKYGIFFGLTHEKITSSEAFIHKHGELGIFISQVLPVVGAIISVPAGILKINYLRFIIYTFSGGAIWCAIIIYIGQKLGENWITISSKLSPFEDMIKALIAGIIALLVVRKIYSYYKTATAS